MSTKKHPDRLLFLHIPKTAGMTLHSIIDRQYPSDILFNMRRMWNIDAFNALSEKERMNIRVLKGHMPFGLHARLGPGEVEYFTILREPVDRVVSHYYQILRYSKHFFYEEMQKHKYTLKELMESGALKYVDNLQVRVLSGNVEAPYGSIDDAMLQQALEHIDRYFPLLGLNEYFDHFLLQLKDRYGWGMVNYRKRLVSKNRIAVTALDPETLAAVQRYNEMDTKLYLLMKARVEQELQALGPAFEKRVQRFKRTNNLLAKILDNIPFYPKAGN